MMSTFPIRYNKPKDLFWIKNSNCLYLSQLVIDVDLCCFQCPHYHGIKTNNKKMKLICKAITTRRYPMPDYKPYTKRELKKIRVRIRGKIIEHPKR